MDRFGGPARTGAPFRELISLEKLVASLGRPDWVADLVLVDDQAMVELNDSFRGAAEVTDVLSFSYLLPRGEGLADLGKGKGLARHDLWLDPMETGELPAGVEGESDGEGPAPLAGELVLAPEFVTARCLQRGWPLEHELPLLLVHGCLHLLGWEHEQEEDRLAMQQQEALLLGAAGLPHALAPDLSGE